MNFSERYNQNVAFDFHATVLDHAALNGADTTFGARNMRTFVERSIGDACAHQILSGEETVSERATFRISNNEVVLACN